MVKDRLTILEQKFVLCYTANGGNGTRAMEEAGYKGSYNVLAVSASRLLKKPKILAAIEARMKELAMSKDEVIYRLSEQAKGSLSPFIGLSVDELKKHPQSWLIKKIKQGVYVDSNDQVHYYVESFELHDAQTALAHLGKFHRLFAEKLEVDWTHELKLAGLDPVEIEDSLAGQLEKYLQIYAESALRGGVE